MQSLQKKQFKAMHSNGQLLLLGAASLTKEASADVVNAAIKLNKLPEGTQTNPGSYGYIDDRHHKVYYDEPNSVIYLERIEVGDDWKAWSSHRPKPHTTVYRVEA